MRAVCHGQAIETPWPPGVASHHSGAVGRGVDTPTAGLVSSGVGLAVENVPVQFAKSRFTLSPIVLPASTVCDKGLG
jgi:hypothetical protein